MMLMELSGQEKPINRVLIVDDVMEMRLLLNGIVLNLANEIFEADDGEQAENKILEHEPDMVLLDYRMPVKNGLEVLKSVRQNSTIKQPLIIMVTANAEDCRDEAMQHGADAFIEKPFQIDKLFNTILKLAKTT